MDQLDISEIAARPHLGGMFIFVAGEWRTALCVHRHRNASRQEASKTQRLVALSSAMAWPYHFTEAAVVKRAL